MTRSSPLCAVEYRHIPCSLCYVIGLVPVSDDDHLSRMPSQSLIIVSRHDFNLPGFATLQNSYSAFTGELFVQIIQPLILII
jgi:hypothetical protein